MLTKLTISNFKGLGDVEIELGSPVVFVGPNNSGKTSAMQALALWDIGVKRWKERRSGLNPRRRTGAVGRDRTSPNLAQRRNRDIGEYLGTWPDVAINRRDLAAIPVPSARMLWRGSQVQNNGHQQGPNVLIKVTVDGVTGGREWVCGMEFDYANAESFYCRPLRVDGKRMPVPKQAGVERIAFLPPMSGLAATETRLPPGAIDVRIGEGRTAEVLRNLCYYLDQERPEYWSKLTEQIYNLFRVKLDAPEYLEERGEIVMTYRERRVSLDLSSSGRGLQQTLLIIAYMYANPGAVILLDEPDAHLEILRQRQIYQLIAETAAASGSQIIAATHSEVLLNEAAGKDMVIAFVGKPHRIDGQGSQVLKALREIGFDSYYQAEQTGWALYLEGSTDLDILRTFAQRLGHTGAIRALERPFVHYVENQPQKAISHYYGLREAVPGLPGIAIFDRLDRGLPESGGLECLAWQRREIENYLCSPATLEAYAAQYGTDRARNPRFTAPESHNRVSIMRESIDEVTNALSIVRRISPWSHDTKSSAEFLEPLFHSYFDKLNLPNLMGKKNFYELAHYIPDDEIDAEIAEKLDAIARVAAAAAPGMADI